MFTIVAGERAFVTDGAVTIRHITEFSCIIQSGTQEFVNTHHFEVVGDPALCPHFEVFEQRWDNGKCAETGYDDAGSVMVCRTCGREL